MERTYQLEDIDIVKIKFIVEGNNEGQKMVDEGLEMLKRLSGKTRLDYYHVKFSDGTECKAIYLRSSKMACIISEKGLFVMPNAENVQEAINKEFDANEIWPEHLYNSDTPEERKPYCAACTATLPSGHPGYWCPDCERRGKEAGMHK